MNLVMLTFLRPWWLLALLALPLAWAVSRRIGDRSGGWSRAVDPHLLPHLLETGGRRRGGWILALAWAVAVVAMAGPSLREAPQPLLRREAPLAIALSMSPAMLSGDLKPSRAERARYEVADLVRTRADGQFALVAYAADAYTVVPVTEDGRTLLALLEALSPAVMPEPGDDAAAAIEHAAGLLADAGFERGDILLMAGGADDDAVAAAASAAARGFRVSVLGVGTGSGAPVPLAGGGFLRDASGEVLLPRLDASALRRVAEAGDGRYATITAGTADLAALGLLAADGGAGLDTATDAARMRRLDDGPWLLLLLLPLAALAFRRGWLACVPLAVLLLPAPAQALDWDVLWKRADQRAWEALQQGEPERARALTDHPPIEAAAAYRSEDYASAVESWSGLEDADAHYNRGNALAKAQRYEEALAAYDEALARAPGMADAQANREAVEQWLRRQREQSGQDPDGERQEPGEDGESGGQGQQGEPGEEGGQGEPQPDQGEQQGRPGEETGSQDQAGRSGEAGEDDTSASGAPDQSEQQQREAAQRFAEAMEQALRAQQAGEGERDGEAEVESEQREREQAVEQWLRRVPDDPGGLLRRKFAIEHQRRQRGGERE